MRFKTYERFLQAAAPSPKISIRKPKTIGKYTRYKIRAARLPVRTDMLPATGQEEAAPAAPAEPSAPPYLHSPRK